VKAKLDTLAQLSTKGILPSKNKALSKSQLEQETYKKRARSKSITNAIVFKLIDLKSPLLKSYWQTFHCNNVLIQKDKTITAKYCNQRWCMQCNRIRTAKQINGYQEPLSKLKEPQFVTLTIVNVPAKELKLAIEQMNHSLRKITKNLPKTYKLKLKGLKKVECTYNPQRNDYHPHFHLIVEGKKEAEHLVSLWLKQYPTAKRKGQDIKKARADSLIELCKYFTKVVNDDQFYPKQMDIIFRAMKGKRTFQPIGLKKIVSEEIDDQQGQEQSFLPPQNEIFVWEQEAMDWISASGEIVADFTPTDRHKDYIDRLQNNKQLLKQPNDESRTKEPINYNQNKQFSTQQIEQGIKDFWT
jgi:plasmid rolling circle replication initiator protein Rep